MTTPYLFGSRILTHIAFWLLYFIAFGFIWAKDGNYYSSFYLEFILLPIRISAVYLMIYFVIPHTLLIKKYGLFLMQYILLLLISGVFQRLFTYFFYEANTTFQLLEIFNFGEILRAIILINSTVIFVSFFKILGLYHKERDQKESKDTLDIKSDHKTHRIAVDDILFIKAMGNYVVYHFENEKKIISYSSMKEAQKSLPPHFKRVHKSYIVNTHKINSYSSDNIDISGNEIPIGKSFAFNGI
jgi:hypothetical protein